MIEEHLTDVSQKPMVLLVEDNHALLNIVRLHLERKGFQLIAVGSGDEAMELLDAGVVPAVLLTDAIMPGKVQGPELALICKRAWPDLPVVLMSGFVRETDLENLPADTITSFLPKPFSLAHLSEEIYDCLLEADRERLRKAA
jgi:two-component system cell cycle sensor histidine kinase/response regulator CckA